MDHTECTPSIQPPNTSYRPRFLQGDHHGNTNYNLHLAAVYYNGPDRNQCTGEKSKCFSWDRDWTVQYSIPSQVTTLDCGTISITSYNVPVVFMSLLNTVALCSKHFISQLRDFLMVGWLCSLTYTEMKDSHEIHVTSYSKGVERNQYWKPADTIKQYTVHLHITHKFITIFNFANYMYNALKYKLRTIACIAIPQGCDVGGVLLAQSL